MQSSRCSSSSLPSGGVSVSSSSGYLDDEVLLTHRKPSAADGKEIGPQGRRVGRRSASSMPGRPRTSRRYPAHLADIKPIPKTAEVGRRFLGVAGEWPPRFRRLSQVPAFRPGSSASPGPPSVPGHSRSATRCIPVGPPRGRAYKTGERDRCCRAVPPVAAPAGAAAPGKALPGTVSLGLRALALLKALFSSSLDVQIEQGLKSLRGLRGFLERRQGRTVAIECLPVARVFADERLADLQHRLGLLIDQQDCPSPGRRGMARPCPRPSSTRRPGPPPARPSANRAAPAASSPRRWGPARLSCF